ncbi:hypothetical protein BST81_16425 [Leptolyngbya sp. 'hensonii']|nr:hypothetical protein BST81_16425 [Leptolyngbya sp. 'hensonii']
MGNGEQQQRVIKPAWEALPYCTLSLIDAWLRYFYQGNALGFSLLTSISLALPPKLAQSLNRNNPMSHEP